MPVLVVFGRNDTIIPEAAIRAAANRMRNAKYYMLESNHFELCAGDVFEANIALQIKFMNENMPVSNVK